jgi:RNA polymerase sigma-70 factor (ECF subfamily)
MKQTSRRLADNGCQEQLRELFDYIDGELTAGRCRAIERHLADCPCCDTLAANLRQAIALCRAEGQRQLPKPLRARALRRVRALLADREPSRS